MASKSARSTAALLRRGNRYGAGLAFSHLKGPLWQQKRLALLWHRFATGEKLAEDDLFKLDERNIILFGAHA
jgi:hypothetical protein